MDRFPDIDAADLDGREYHLPVGLPAGPRLLIVASRRWQQVLIEMWKAHLRPLARNVPLLGVWELALLPRVYAPARPIIDGGMRAGITDPAVRRKTLTAYVDTEAFAAALGLGDLETVHVMLLGADGEVVWRASGKPEPGTVKALEEVLAWWCAEGGSC